MLIPSHFFPQSNQLTDNEVSRFSHLLHALSCGAPPHGGIALGESGRFSLSPKFPDVLFSSFQSPPLPSDHRLRSIDGHPDRLFDDQGRDRLPQDGFRIRPCIFESSEGRRGSLPGRESSRGLGCPSCQQGPETLWTLRSPRIDPNLGVGLGRGVGGGSL
ncbi:hypothetical protein IE53DRAFT_288708 [Violaceomyces palustris]|uniref:Uncharacterized protein n=1 Tax=Violaceomyces palustris TaxID=1673888 RepID=A0ACD0NLY7_9BASI|nr:hypothetical protein IE53DRAFT_288708 [Violaceomyces palustris]